MSQKKNYKRLIDHRTKGFCSIINFAFDLNRKHSHLDFELTFAQILYELTKIRQFQKCQVDFNFQNFSNFWGIDFHNTYAKYLYRHIWRIIVEMIAYFQTNEVFDEIIH